MGYNYSDSYITEHASSGGKDPGRKATLDALFARAQQGDQAAIAQIRDLSGGPLDPTPDTHFATSDAQNYGRMLEGRLGLGAPQYNHSHDGSFSLGKALGGVLEYAAPIAASLIPGVGPLAAGAIAAGGTGVGRAIEGKPFSLKSELLSGAGGAGGNLLLGDQGLGGVSGIPGRLGLGGGGGAQVGNMTQGMGGAMATDGATAVAPGAAGSGFSIGGALKTAGHYLPTAIAGMNAIGAYQNAHKASQLRDQAMQQAQQEYQDRAPFRLKATEFAEQPMPQAPDLTSTFADPGNPYYRAPQRPAPTTGRSY